MRCIYLTSNDIDPSIQGFRVHNDLLGNLVKPHVTVVFPFELSITDEILVDHIQNYAKRQHQIAAQFGTVVESEDGYVCLEIVSGAFEIQNLNERLYSGPLKDIKSDRKYSPHLTIGRTTTGETRGIMDRARKLEFQSNFTLTDIVIENIGEQGESIPIAEYNLV